jgi:hypothetical protein
VLSKYQGEILKYGGALLRRNFGVGICAHLWWWRIFDIDEEMATMGDREEWDGEGHLHHLYYSDL